jgi:hypothetical protein
MDDCNALMHTIYENAPMLTSYKNAPKNSTAIVPCMIFNIFVGMKM